MTVRSEWLEQLPAIVDALKERWSLEIGPPIENNETTCAWVAPVTMRDGSPAVLKVGMPHFEAEHEIEGLRFWKGNPTVNLIRADEKLGAMLIEQCSPGTHLRSVLSEPEQDEVIASLLRRLWRPPGDAHRFRPLSEMISFWTAETLRKSKNWPDEGLVRKGLNVFEDLLATTTDSSLLATDLHAGNVLRAERETWLVIDPKPFVGDAAYDVTQHLMNCRERLRDDPKGTVKRVASLAGVNYERVRLWLFARLAAEPRDDWSEMEAADIARALVDR